MDEIRASVIIPAHNESAVIARLLSSLQPVGNSRHDLVVICNGCTDDTADVARRFTGVRVLETPVPSKQEALRLGDAHAEGFPRIYVDADVELGAADLDRLCSALTEPGVLAASPRRMIPREGVGLAVRCYYDVWERLPQVASAIFGRGVIGLTKEGFARVCELPQFMADDLAMSSAFSPAERRVVEDAVVVVRPPKVWADLIKRRTRAVLGTRETYGSGHEWQTDSRTSIGDLIALLRGHPALAPRMVFFVLATLIARRRAAKAHDRGQDQAWLRDESSRRS